MSCVLVFLQVLSQFEGMIIEDVFFVLFGIVKSPGHINLHDPSFSTLTSVADIGRSLSEQFVGDVGSLDESS